MTCKCSPSLTRLMADFAKRGHVNSGCCGDAAHQARKSDHNPDASGYAHAQDVHEKNDHDMRPFVDFIMRHPDLFPQVKYLIYERVIYYPHAAGSRRPGPYAYTGPNAHAAHLHVSIFANATNYGGSWHVAEAYGSPATPDQEDDFMATLTDAEKAKLISESTETWQRVKNLQAVADRDIDTLRPILIEVLEAVKADASEESGGPGAVTADAVVDALAARLKN